MKTRLLFVLMVLMSMVLVAPAQGTKKPMMGKKKPAHSAPASKKKTLPARDPKTGRFVKKSAAVAPKKTLPARDPKTGRFIKKPGTTKKG